MQNKENLMQNEPQKEWEEEVNAFAPEDREKCDTYLDHYPAWCGDVFACAKCGLIFIPKTFIQKARDEGYECGLSAGKEFIKQAEEKIRQDILKEMLSECDKTENEQGRLLVKQFMKKLKTL